MSEKKSIENASSIEGKDSSFSNNDLSSLNMHSTSSRRGLCQEIRELQQTLDNERLVRHKLENELQNANHKQINMINALRKDSNYWKEKVSDFKLILVSFCEFGT